MRTISTSHLALAAATILLAAFCVCAAADTPANSAATGNVNYHRPFEPPTRPEFIPLPPGAIEPAGWLRDWCLAAKEFTSRLDDRDIAFRQAWAADYKVTGDRISLWENGGWPYEGGGYWFEGLAKLGFILHDQSLIDQAKKRFGVIIENMNDNSVAFMWWLDKNNAADFKAVEGRGLREPEWPMWVNGLMGRAMTGYYAGSGDGRALKTLERAYSGSRDFVTLGWGMTNPWPAFQTYTWTGNETIKQGLDDLFNSPGDDKKPWSYNRYRRLPTDSQADNAPDHGVHFCESSSPWALGYLWTGKREFLDGPLAWHDRIARECMQPHGVPVFDEYWGPTGAFRGSETCDVGAYMWSQQLLLAISGRPSLADRIERAFFNAAPATVSRDFKTHCYFQSPNRIANHALPAAEPFTFKPTHNPLCCTAVVNRLLPNYVINMWMATQDNGLAALCYGPCKVTAQVADHVPVELTCTTDYPFIQKIEITVNPARPATFPLLLRIPDWCKNSSVKKYNSTSLDGFSSLQDGRFVRIDSEWKPNDKITLDLPMSPKLATGKDANAAGAPYATVSYGPLLFSLPIADTADPNTPDPAAKWRFALDAPQKNSEIAVERAPMPARWDWPLNSPLKLRVRAVPFDWQPTLEKPLPAEPIATAAPTEPLTLVPYGCTKLRVSMFPITAKRANADERNAEK